VKPADTSERPRKESLSTTPSWLMLGFLIGAVTMYSSYERLFQKAPAEPVAPAVRVEVQRVVVPPVPDVEAIFLRYQDNAVWENDLTEVALWNPTSERFSELYEVLRTEDHYFFRSITTLTRPVAEYADEESVPIRFTESEAQRAKRLEKVPSFFRPAPPKL
jgi:hypothetical protein